jgi:hypothetical protein
MRGPVLSDWKAAILEVPMASIFDGQPGDAVLHQLGYGRNTAHNARGIRDLVAYQNWFLVLAGHMRDPPEGHEIRKGDYTIILWSGTALTVKVHLDGYGNEVKPEAIVPLGEMDGKVRALILFDGQDEGMPTPITIDMRKDH